MHLATRACVLAESAVVWGRDTAEEQSWLKGKTVKHHSACIDVCDSFSMGL